MPAGFSFIEQYRTMAKDLERQSCEEILNLDQEVPQSRHFLDDVKSEIKHETPDDPPDLFSFSMIDSIMVHSSTTEDQSNSNKNYPNFFGSNIHKKAFISDTGSQSKLTPVTTPPPTTMTKTLPLLSSTSPMMSSTTLSSLLPFPAPASIFTPPSSSSTTTKTNTFVTELAGSGCTVFSNPDFLLDTTSSLTSLGDQEDSREYIDLNKHASVYEDYGSFLGRSDEANRVPLEEAVIVMTSTIQSDCENINVPFDPMTWTTEHVTRWVSWVCQKNKFDDISLCFSHVDGRSLCSIKKDVLLNSFGDAGIKIFNELDLLTTANNCFSSPINGTDDDLAYAPQLHDSYLDNPTMFNSGSCVSPAPSTCSSTHDSLTSIISTHSDHSDDESGYASQLSSYSFISKSGGVNGFNRISAKAPAGRGHKQTIHLWQFLKELLLSKDNNYSDCIRWIDRNSGVFKIEDSKRVANLWGARKNRPAMNYDKLSRSVRQYYKKGIIKKTEQSKRLVYQFCAGYM